MALNSSSTSLVYFTLTIYINLPSRVISPRPMPSSRAHSEKVILKLSPNVFSPMPIILEMNIRN